ncbi:hypothetical protein ACIQCJ_09430 [Streptomyces sp. NPDC093221]|uniref:hypothetical protein n=1 Tax=unclassified Streptomyces TaxID=2593676 RepID=UPI0036EE7789
MSDITPSPPRCTSAEEAGHFLGRRELSVLLCGALPFIAPWLRPRNRPGQRLGGATQDGASQRGIRDVLAHHALFAWNGSAEAEKAISPPPVVRLRAASEHHRMAAVAARKTGEAVAAEMRRCGCFAGWLFVLRARDVAVS